MRLLFRLAKSRGETQRKYPPHLPPAVCFPRARVKLPRSRIDFFRLEIGLPARRGDFLAWKLKTHARGFISPARDFVSLAWGFNCQAWGKNSLPMDSLPWLRTSIPALTNSIPCPVFSKTSDVLQRRQPLRPGKWLKIATARWFQASPRAEAPASARAGLRSSASSSGVVDGCASSWAAAGAADLRSKGRSPAGPFARSQVAFGNAGWSEAVLRMEWVSAGAIRSDDVAPTHRHPLHTK